MMSKRASAARYARALLDVAAKEGDPEKAAQELDDFIQLLHGHAALERVMLNPAVPTSRKRAAVVELTKLANVSPIVSKLLGMLAECGRLELLDELSAAYRQLLLDRSGVARAEVTTTVPLSRERTETIEKRLTAITGKRISMVTKIDKEIIGGVVARVGSIVYDGSVATQLKLLRERLSS